MREEVRQRCAALERYARDELESLNTQMRTEQQSRGGEERRLGQAMGLLGTASLVTNALAPALFESVAARWGWAPVFVAASATGLITLLLTFSLPRPATATFSSSDALPTPPLTNSRLSAATLATGAAFGTLISFTQPFALARGAERVSTYLVGYTLGALFVRIALGSLADRVGRLRVAQWALFAYGAVALLTSLLEPSLLLPLGVLFGAANAYLGLRVGLKK